MSRSTFLALALSCALSYVAYGQQPGSYPPPAPPNGASCKWSGCNAPGGYPGDINRPYGSSSHHTKECVPSQGARQHSATRMCEQHDARAV